MRHRFGPTAVAIILTALVVAPAALAPARAAFPPLTTAEYSAVLGALAVPSTAPGGSTTESGTLTNPLPGTLTDLNLTLQVYAFNGFPGNATGGINPATAPAFNAPTGAGLTDWFTVPSLAPGATYQFTATLVVPTAAPPGAYAVRSHLIFVENGSTYLLASRGYFAYDAWANASRTSSGAPTINLTALDVSGVLPETAVGVVANPFPWVVATLLGGAAILAVAGGYYAAVRPRPGSRSGARRPPPASAPRAFGKSPSSVGD